MVGTNPIVLFSARKESNRDCSSEIDLTTSILFIITNLIRVLIKNDAKQRNKNETQKESGTFIPDFLLDGFLYRHLSTDYAEKTDFRNGDPH
jgi:hypothetical protein